MKKKETQEIKPQRQNLKNTKKLPQNFADTLLNLELDIEQQNPIEISTITQLIQLYVTAIEYYEIQKNDRFQVFQNKLQRLFTNPQVSLALSQNNKINKEQPNKNYLVARKLTEIQQQVEKQSDPKNEINTLFEKIKLKEMNVKDEINEQENKIQQRLLQLKERKKQKLIMMSEQNSVVSFGESSSNNPESPLNDFKKSQRLDVISKKLRKILNFTSTNQCISETVSEEDEKSKEVINKSQQESKEENKKKQITMLKKASFELDEMISKFLQKKHVVLIKPIKKCSFAEDVQKYSVKQSSNSIHINQKNKEKNQYSSLITLKNKSINSEDIVKVQETENIEEEEKLEQKEK